MIQPSGQGFIPNQAPSLFSADAACCARRHGGAPTSIAAHRRVLPHKRETHERIVAYARFCGADGVTVQEVSGRLSELKAAGRLVPLHDDEGRPVRRRGAAALIVAELPTPGP